MNKLMPVAALMAAVAALSACERKETVVTPPMSAPAPSTVVVPAPAPGPAGAPGPSGAPGTPGAPAPSPFVTGAAPAASGASGTK